MKANRPAIVLLSGGQDSVTSLFWALNNPDFGQVQAVSFDYGQRHRVELDQAAAIASDAMVPHHVLAVPGLGTSALTEHEKDIDAAHELNPNLPASFVPARNALFLTLAGALAYRQGISDLVTGVCQTDYSGYPDCRRAFIDSQALTLSLGLDAPLRIHTPLMYLTKAETWKLAFDLGAVAGMDVFETVRLRSHTDYTGDRTTLNAWGYGNTGNAASRIRAEGFRQAQEKGWIPPRAEPEQIEHSHA